MRAFGPEHILRISASSIPRFTDKELRFELATLQSQLINHSTNQGIAEPRHILFIKVHCKQHLIRVFILN